MLFRTRLMPRPRTIRLRSRTIRLRPRTIRLIVSPKAIRPMIIRLSQKSIN